MGVVLSPDDDRLRVVGPAKRGVVDRGGVLGGGRDGTHGVLGVEGAHVGQAARGGRVVAASQRWVAGCRQGAVHDVGSWRRRGGGGEGGKEGGGGEEEGGEGRGRRRGGEGRGGGGGDDDGN